MWESKDTVVTIPTVMAEGNAWQTQPGIKQQWLYATSVEKFSFWFLNSYQTEWSMKVKPFRCHCIMGFIGKHCGARSLIWKLRKILDSTNYWPLKSDLILNPQWKKLFLCHCITVYRFSKVSIFEVLIPLIFILCCHFNSLLLLGLFVRIILNFGAVWIHHDYVFLTFRADLLQNWKK